jgi:pimeloyl-ACP methyl ester carboxylesterase
MTEMREGSILCLDPHGFHRLRYVEWGDPANPRVLVCVHGLTRNGRDFDYLASRMADHYRVVCPDVVGRGQSGWLKNKADYGYAVYLADMAALLGKLGAEEVDWVGTSMGGLIGMLFASIEGTPVRKLVINDVGSFLPKAALERIGSYVGKSPAFDTLEAMIAAVRSVSPFGELTDEQWRHLTLTGAKQDAGGKWVFRYDPGIGEAFHAAPLTDVDMRMFWMAVKAPVLLIRGEHSDLLTPETLAEMLKRPGTSSVIVPNVAHAPMLLDDAQVDPIRAFLLG